VNYRILIDPRAARQLESLPKAVVENLDRAILSLPTMPRPPGQSGSKEGYTKAGESGSEATAFCIRSMTTLAKGASLTSAIDAKFTAELSFCFPCIRRTFSHNGDRRS